MRGQAGPNATLSILAGAPSVSTSRAGQDFAATAQVGNPASDLYLQVTNVATLAPVANLPETKATNVTSLYVPAGSSETLVYDSAGNLTIDGRWVYTWDAYNRLTRVESKAGAPEASKRKIEFTYDAQGRRIAKVTSVWTNGAYAARDSRKFVYDGWKLFAELNATNNTPIRTYGWAGNRLLTIEQKTTGKVYIPVLDVHGNVMALVARDTGAVEARYEYGPYGLLVRAVGPMALENPIRFSSEYQDDITGFIYYGCRYFNPTTQRWLNPDPIGFAGGANLYGFLDNDPINGRDALGLTDVRLGVGLPVLPAKKRAPSVLDGTVFDPRLIFPDEPPPVFDYPGMVDLINNAGSAYSRWFDQKYQDLNLLPNGLVREGLKAVTMLPATPAFMAAAPCNIYRDAIGLAESDTAASAAAYATATAFNVAAVFPVGSVERAATVATEKRILEEIVTGERYLELERNTQQLQLLKQDKIGRWWGVRSDSQEMRPIGGLDTGLTRVHGNKLEASGPHEVYAIRDLETGQIYHFGETGRGLETRGQEWVDDLRQDHGLDAMYELLDTVEGKAAARDLETRYIDTYEKIFGFKPRYTDANGNCIQIQKTRH